MPGPPARIVFTQATRRRAGGRRTDQLADLLVPAGREDEGRALVECFTAEVVAGRG